jgi:prepilin-type N-terminal cleavage/methylation domain-containing protein
MKPKRFKNKITSNAGMTLIETVVAMLIIVIVAVAMVGGFGAMAKMDMASTDQVNADKKLSEAVATDTGGTSVETESYTKEPLDKHTLSLNNGGVHAEIPIQSLRYTDKTDGSGFTTFDFDE